MPKHFRQLWVKDLPKVPMSRLEWDSNQWPFGRKAPNSTTELKDEQAVALNDFCKIESSIETLVVNPFCVCVRRDISSPNKEKFDDDDDDDDDDEYKKRYLSLK